MILAVKAEGIAGKSVTVSLASYKPTTGSTLGYFSDGRGETPAIEVTSEPTVTLLSSVGTRTTSDSNHPLLYPYNLLMRVLLLYLEDGGSMAI
jgi:hypothetical protein